MKRMFLILLLPVILIAGETLVIGTTSGYAPFVSLNSQGEYEGFDIDVAELVAQKLCRKLEIKDCGSMTGLMLALKQKKVDALIWAISITEERQKTLEMIYYQGEKVSEMPFLFWKEIPAHIRSIEDLGQDHNSSVCVEAGTFQEAVIKKFPNIQFKNVDKITDVLLELRYGKSKAAAIDPSLVSRFQTQYPDLRVLKLPLSPSDQALGNGICIHKDNQQLAQQVRQAIEELRNSGKIAELEKKWNLETP